jgi:diacylglycerol kinase (ATP)
MSGLRVVIAYNPQSGSFSQKRLDQLRAAFTVAGYDCDFADSHGSELPRLAIGADHLCIVGGDGTLRDVVACIGRANDLPPISVYPAGTINLVARELSYPRKIPDFVKRVTAGSPLRALHLGILQSRPMLVCASVGPDSLSVAAVSNDLKRRAGRFAYLAALFRLFLQWPRHQLTVLANGQKFACEAAFVLKGRYFAGPWRLSRDADMTGPAFQLLLLHRARRSDYLRLIISIIAIPALASRHWVRFAASSVEIAAQTALPVQVDGDIAAVLPVTATVDPVPVWFS